MESYSGYIYNSSETHVLCVRVQWWCPYVCMQGETSGSVMLIVVKLYLQGASLELDSSRKHSTCAVCQGTMVVSICAHIQ